MFSVKTVGLLISLAYPHSTTLVAQVAVPWEEAGAEEGQLGSQVPRSRPATQLGAQQPMQLPMPLWPFVLPAGEDTEGALPGKLSYLWTVHPALLSLGRSCLCQSVVHVVVRWWALIAYVHVRCQDGCGVEAGSSGRTRNNCDPLVTSVCTYMSDPYAVRQ